MLFETLSGRELVRLIVSIAAAYLLALPLGWERKRHSHAYIGLRVFPLVAVGACVYVFLGQQLFTGNESGEQSQMLQGLMTGIGFVGAGAIMKESGDIHGVATAAAIWTTGAIGAAVAYGDFVLAVSVSLLSLFILGVTRKLGRDAREALAGDYDRDGEEH